MDEMNAFAASLRAEEKSAATVKKYLRDVEAFLTFAAGRTLTKQLVLLTKDLKARTEEPGLEWATELRAQYDAAVSRGRTAFSWSVSLRAREAPEESR